MGKGGGVGRCWASGRGGISHSRQWLPVEGHLSLPHAGAGARQHQGHWGQALLRACALFGRAALDPAGGFGDSQGLSGEGRDWVFLFPKCIRHSSWDEAWGRETRTLCSYPLSLPTHTPRRRTHLWGSDFSWAICLGSTDKQQDYKQGWKLLRPLLLQNSQRRAIGDRGGQAKRRLESTRNRCLINLRHYAGCLSFHNLHAVKYTLFSVRFCDFWQTHSHLTTATINTKNSSIVPQNSFLSFERQSLVVNSSSRASSWQPLPSITIVLLFLKCQIIGNL